MSIERSEFGTWAAVAASAAVALAGCVASPTATPTGPPAPVGEIKGRATEHTDASRATAAARAQVALPATAGAAYFGRWADVPASATARVPVVVFLHGSSGLSLKAIEEWQRWLATQGIASVAPDSFALPDRLTYTSPIDKAVYERIHRLRASEAAAALDALKQAPWADPARVVLAGTSEGAVAVARHDGIGLAGRMIFAWSCEDNYFVTAHATQVASASPVLNIISSTDPFFSRSNTWLGNAAARGHCAEAFAAHKQTTVVLVPGAPHTLLNLPQVRAVTGSFLRQVFGS